MEVRWRKPKPEESGAGQVAADGTKMEARDPLVRTRMLVGRRRTATERLVCLRGESDS